MKMFKCIVMVFMIGFASIVLAADRENYGVTVLRIGTEQQQVSGDGTQLLEQLLSGTTSVSRVNADTLYGYSGFWDEAPFVSAPSTAFRFFDDFFYVGTSTNVTEATSSLIPWLHLGDTGPAADTIVGATAGGVLSQITGQTDNNEVYLQYGSKSAEGQFNITSNGAKKVWFEARVRAAPNANEGGFFVGLADPGSAAANFLVDDSGVVDTNKNHIGFWIGTSDKFGNYSFVVGKADAAAGSLADSLVSTNTSSYVRLGFMFDGVRTTKVYVNGTAKSRVHTNNAVSYPDAVVMAPIIASKTGGSYSNTNLIDYISIIQER